METRDNKLLEKTIVELAKSNIKYRNACIKKYGYYKDDEELYSKYHKKSWDNYLKSGGDRSMINYQLPEKKDFGYIQKKLNSEGSLNSSQL